MPVHWESTTNRMMITIVPRPIFPPPPPGIGRRMAPPPRLPPLRVSIWPWSILAFGLKRNGLVLSPPGARLD